VDPTRAHYEDTATAADYRGRFSKSWARRLSNRVELRMLRNALERAGRGGRVLDVPCGAGRLTATIAEHAREVVAVDVARAMLAEARGTAAARGASPAFVNASAFALPFADGAFDLAVCWRLLQHFESAVDRARILRELGRVTRRAIVLSFSDAETGRARRLARRSRTKPGRVAITRRDLSAELESCGLRAERFYRLFGPLSVVAAVVARPRS
jgi:ubiquinone/menaquinone biosynthesis C-methylase UbiE